MPSDGVSSPGYAPLRRPSTWIGQPSVRAKGAMDNVLLIVGGIAGIAIGIVGVYQWAPVAIVWGFGWAFSFLTTSAVLGLSDVRWRRRVVPMSSAFVERLGQPAVVIGYKRRGVDVGLVVALIVFPLSAHTGVGALATALEPALRDGASVLGAFGFGALTAVSLWTIVRSCSRSYRDDGTRQFVAAGEPGILHVSLDWTAYFSWDDIIRVLASPLPNQRVHFVSRSDRMHVDDRRRIRLPKFDDISPANTGFDAGRLAMERPTAAYWGVKFYHENPEYRWELGTEVGLRRFREGDFPCDEEPED